MPDLSGKKTDEMRKNLRLIAQTIFERVLKKEFYKHMSNEHESKIRDLRNGGWYWINRHIIKQYGKLLRASGLAVYNVLASYANLKTQTCFPTQKSIAELLRLSIRTVNRKIRLLKDFKLIRVEKIRSRCFYFLLKVDTPKGIQPYDKRDAWYRTPGKSNNNKIIKINNKNKYVNENFNNFKPLSRFLKTYGQRISKNNRN